MHIINLYFCQEHLRYHWAFINTNTLKTLSLIYSVCILCHIYTDITNLVTDTTGKPFVSKLNNQKCFLDVWTLVSVLQ